MAQLLESNPDTINKYLEKLGVSKWRVVDVIGLEGEALSWVPRPVLAVILLFPISEAYELHRCAEEVELRKKSTEVPKDLFHLKQVLSNGCGTIALVHSVANNVNKIEITNGPLKTFIDDAKNLDAMGKGNMLEQSKWMFETYKKIVGSGGSGGEQDGQDVAVNHHYVTFIHKDGKLYELDGRKEFPVEHGTTNPDNLLEDAAKICMGFIAREPDNIGFNVMALVPADS